MLSIWEKLPKQLKMLVLPTFMVEVLKKVARNLGIVNSFPVDLSAAADWFERAGTGDSLMFAAQILSSRDPTYPPNDMKRAIHLYRRSGNAGHSPACLYLGRYYERSGQTAESFKWYMKAARQGDQEAREILQAKYRVMQEERRLSEEEMYAEDEL